MSVRSQPSAEPRPWTPAEDARLAELRDLYFADYRKIAPRLGRGGAECKARWAELSRAAARPAPRRRCLMCREAFPAVPGLWVCEPCKRSERWRSGGAFA